MRRSNLLKRVTGILLSLAVVACMVMMPVEAKAEIARPVPTDNFYDGVQSAALSECYGFGNVTYSSSNLSRSVTVYYLITDSSTKLYVLHYDSENERWNKGSQYYWNYTLEMNAATVIGNWLNGATDSDIDTYYNNGYAVFWNASGDGADGNGAPGHAHTWVFGTIYDATESTDGLEGEYCSCGAVRNTSVIPAGDMIIANNYKKIDAAKSGQNVVLDMKTMCNLSQAFMKRLASKNNCSFTIRLMYQHKLYEFYIPAGTSFDTSLEYCGPEKLMEMFDYIQK